MHIRIENIQQSQTERNQNPTGSSANLVKKIHTSDFRYCVNTIMDAWSGIFTHLNRGEPRGDISHVFKSVQILAQFFKH